MPRGELARLSGRFLTARGSGTSAPYGAVGAVVGGALAACALPAPGLWPLAWVGLAPLVAATGSAATRRRAALAGFAAGLAYHAVVLHWIYLTCRFARVPAPVSLLAWAALSSLLALNWAAAAALARELAAPAPSALRPWLWALCWTAVAAATERFTPRLAVDLLAYTQWPNLSLLQAGSWGGPHLVGFAVCAVNAALAGAWRERSAAPLALPLALAGGLWAHGSWLMSRRPADPGPTARVEILQPCVEQYHKWDEAFIGGIFSGFEELLARPRPKPPALVVWPETAIPRWVSRSAAVPEAARWAVSLRAQHLVGVIAEPEGGAGAANAVQLIGADGRVAGVYAKRELVPFGEFVPLRRWVPDYVIARWLAVLDQLGDMTAGAPEQPLLRTAWGATAATICYEAMFPRWARRDAARGARLLVNVTNDAWYKDTWGPRQHYRANLFRAVENRVTVVRSGNTGISAVIDPWGVATAELDLNVRGRLDAEIPLADPFPARSFYARHGDWFGAGALGLVLLGVLRRARA